MIQTADNVSVQFNVSREEQDEFALNSQKKAIEAIERIEVVKGGGSVLYGSEAQSGVINIITKKKISNKVRAGFGNYKQQQYNVCLLYTSRCV